jgi:hypothetical protein
MIGWLFGSTMTVSESDPVNETPDHAKSGQVENTYAADTVYLIAQNADPPASPQQPVPDNGALDFLETKFSVTKAVVKCGRSDILVTTACIPNDETYCFSQDVSFVSRGTNQAMTISYPHPFRKGNPTFVMNALCLKAESEFFVMLESTNFDNCLACAWWDVFTADGIYLGSTAGMANDGSFVVKKLPAALLRLLFNASQREVIEVSGLHISRPEPAE